MGGNKEERVKKVGREKTRLEYASELRRKFDYKNIRASGSHLFC